jgi:hypothetical protein
VKTARQNQNAQQNAAPVAQQLLVDLGIGQLQYVRLADKMENPGSLLANRTITMTRGGMLDVLAQRTSSMGPGKVVYTPGLRAWRKIAGDVITYRFSIPEDAPVGATYTIRALGNAQKSPFTFVVRAS